MLHQLPWCPFLSTVHPQLLDRVPTSIVATEVLMNW